MKDASSTGDDVKASGAETAENKRKNSGAAGEAKEEEKISELQSRPHIKHLHE